KRSDAKSTPRSRLYVSSSRSAALARRERRVCFARTPQEPAMTDLSPFALASRQIALDRAATAAIPALFQRKKERILGSPHAFLPGSATLFYEILPARPDLAGGPDGEGWLVGDCHLENVGAYRTDADEVVFDLNDFDDATIGPWRLDVVRLTTSVLLA